MTATWKPGETFKSEHYALYDELRDADGLLLGWIEQFAGQDELSQFDGDSGDSCYAWARPQNQDEPINVPWMEVEESIFKRLGCIQDVPTAKRRVEITAGVRSESSKMTTDPIIEAAARALRASDKCLFYWNDDVVEPIVRGVLAAVTPLIRNDALEEAAAVAEDKAEKLDSNEAWGAAVDIATAVRNLKRQP